MYEMPYHNRFRNLSVMFRRTSKAVADDIEGNEVLKLSDSLESDILTSGCFSLEDSDRSSLETRERRHKLRRAARRLFGFD